MSSKNVIDLRRGTQKPAREVRVETPERAPVNARRTSALKLKRRRLRLVVLGVSLLVVALLVAGVSYVSYLPRYTIQEINVTGAQKVPVASIQSIALGILHPAGRTLLSSANIFVYKPQAIASAITTQFPRVQSAQVTREGLFSTTLTIAVVERSAFGEWCSAADTPNTCYLMDATGFIFDQVALGDASSTERVATPYVFYGGLDTSDADAIGRSFVSAHLPGILAFMQNLKEAGYTPEGAAVQNDLDFSVPLAEGFYVKASFGENPAQLVKNLELILASDELQKNATALQYVDLRFGDRVYYRLKGAIDATSTDSH